VAIVFCRLFGAIQIIRDILRGPGRARETAQCHQMEHKGVMGLKSVQKVSRIISIYFYVPLHQNLCDNLGQ
jgi:hypothetical protein